MKWFKHFSQAKMDAKLVMLRSEFGMWGLGVYWTLLEFIAEQMKGVDPQPVATLSMRELCSFFGCKRDKLETFLKRLQNVRGMDYALKRDILVIECPKLLEIKDNYHKDLEETSKPLGRDFQTEGEVEEEVHTEEEKEKKGGARPQSLDEVVAYFVESGSDGSDAQTFWDHFQSNGWKIGGRSAMKDWRAASRNWIRRSAGFGRGKMAAKEDEEAKRVEGIKRKWGVNQ